ncbi:putative reverse transcriptase domain-containing protein [Tanacetum coccineum]
MSSSNVKVMKSRRRKITKAFRITTNMSMSDHSSTNGKMKKRSQVIQVLEIKIKLSKQVIQVLEIKIKLSKQDLKEIQAKLETFTSTISSLSSQVAELKNIQWKLPAEFLNLPSQVSSVQEKLKNLDSLPSLLHKVIDTLNRFATMVENTLGATSMNVPLAGKATASPAEGEKNTKDAETNLQKQLIDLLGIEVVQQYHNKKLLFDKYCDKMLKRRKRSKIINCDILTQKGPISLKVYREDGLSEVIENLKVCDLHLAEWRQVVQACPDRREKRWKTIYGLIKTRMEYLEQTEKELKIDFSKPLKKQDPLNELNELANKKGRRTNDLKDYSRLFIYSNKGTLLGSDPEPFSLLVLRRLGSIFTSVYVPVQKLKKALGTMAGVDVDTLTMEQYLALSRENQAPGVVKPEIRGNVNFELKSQFMRELREDTFSGNKDEDPHNHIDRQWVDRLALRTINTWDLFKKAFIQRYCPPSMTVKQLEDIHNFKQEGDESLYQAWERYNDLLYKCLLMTSTVIKSRNIGSSNSKDGLATLVNKLDNLGRDMKKLKESVHAIQAGCQICKGPHLDKDYPLNEEVKQVKEVRYGEFGRTTPFNGNNGGRQILAETIKKYIKEASMRQDLVANKPLIMENKDVKINRRCSTLLFNQIPPKEKDPGSFILPCSIGSPKGIVRSLLIKIDKFILPIDFIVLDVLEDFRMHVILGRTLLATAHAKVDVLKKSISLEVGNEKVIFKMKSGLPDIRNESVLMIYNNMIAEEDELMNIESDLFTYITKIRESCQILAIDTDLFTYEVVAQETYDEITHKCSLTVQEAIEENTRPILGRPHWCTPIYRQNNGIQEVWASCNPSSEKCDGGSLL